MAHVRFIRNLQSFHPDLKDLDVPAATVADLIKAPDKIHVNIIIGTATRKGHWRWDAR